MLKNLAFTYSYHRRKFLSQKTTEEQQSRYLPGVYRLYNQVPSREDLVIQVTHNTYRLIMSTNLTHYVIFLSSLFAIVTLGQLSKQDAGLDRFPSTTENDGMFASNVDLQGLLYTERELVPRLEAYIEEELQRLNHLKQAVNEYKEFGNRAEVEGEKFVGNPLNSFLLIKKLTSEWKILLNLIQDDTGEKFLQNITMEKQRMGLRWPDDEDLNGAAVGLTRLQDTYRLDTSSLADGILNGRHYGPSLTAHDCFELGRQMYNNGDYMYTNLWMEEALRKLDEEDDKTASKDDILEYLAFSAYMNGNIRRALKLTNELLHESPNHPRAHGNKQYYEQTLHTKGATMEKRGEDGLGDAEETVNILKERQKRDYSLGEERLIYEQLCRGEGNPQPEQVSNLKCSYTTGSHPFLILGPMKKEVIHMDPKLFIIHDFVLPREIETLKMLASPRLKRATVQNYKSGNLETANYRISKTAWLKEQEHTDVGSIYRRTTLITGLNMETSEELQVANYGIGGHYEPHFDFARKGEKDAFKSLGTGNRIATVLMYLSDVEQGGATVFPPLNLTIWPRKGAAAFWYNLFQNGEGDERTRHAACPVLAGTKWASNFWIHERGQEFSRPCSTDPFK